MTLRFRVEMTKSVPRIAVLRIIKNKRGEETVEMIGSFGQRKSPDLLIDKLTEDEQYELENFLSSLDFSKSFFNIEADKLDRFIIKVAPQFQEALYELWKLAKKYDLEFIPEKEMLYGVFNKAKEIEEKINKITGSKSNVLEKMGINIHEVSDSISSDLESKKLFQAILDLNVPPEDLCKEFEKIAQQTYHKKARFEPHYFKYYADPAVTKRFPQWYYTIAIDLLHKHGVNPIHLIPAQKVAKHWARLRVHQIPISDAKNLFIKDFSPAKDSQKKCLEVINTMYLTQEKKDK